MSSPGEASRKPGGRCLLHRGTATLGLVIGVLGMLAAAEQLLAEGHGGISKARSRLALYLILFLSLNLAEFGLTIF